MPSQTEEYRHSLTAITVSIRHAHNHTRKHICTASQQQQWAYALLISTHKSTYASPCKKDLSAYTLFYAHTSTHMHRLKSDFGLTPSWWIHTHTHTCMHASACKTAKSHRVWPSTREYKDTCIASQLSQWAYAGSYYQTSTYMFGSAKTAVSTRLVHTHTDTHTRIALWACSCRCLHTYVGIIVLMSESICEHDHAHSYACLGVIAITCRRAWSYLWSHLRWTWGLHTRAHGHECDFAILCMYRAW